MTLSHTPVDISLANPLKKPSIDKKNDQIHKPASLTIKDFQKRSVQTEKNKSIKKEFIQIDAEVKLLEQCTFCPKLNDNDIKQSFEERQNRSTKTKEILIEKYKRQEELNQKESLTFRPKIIKVTKTKNSKPANDKAHSKTGNILVPNKRNRSLSKNSITTTVNSLYDDAIRRSQNIVGFSKSKINRSVCTCPYSEKLNTERQLNEMRKLIKDECGEDSVLTQQGVRNIVEKMCGPCELDEFMKILLSHNVIRSQNLFFLLSIIFGIIKVDEKWNNDLKKRDNAMGYEDKEDATIIHFSKSGILEIHNSFSDMRIKRLLHNKPHQQSKNTKNFNYSPFINKRSQSLANNRIRAIGEYFTLYERFKILEDTKKQYFYNIGNSCVR